MFLSTGFMTTAPSELIYTRIVDKNAINPFLYGKGKLCITGVRTLQLAVTNSSTRSALNNYMCMFMFAAAAAGALIHMNFTTMLYIMTVWCVFHVLLFVNISFTWTYMSRTSYDQPQRIPLFQMSCDCPAPHLVESAAATSFLSTHSPIDLLQHFSQSCGPWELSKLSTSVVGGWVFVFLFLRRGTRSWTTGLFFTWYPGKRKKRVA